jgi:lipopolysaccharide/colanic/teichoic acid biosynthesis glycosyltransferase
MRMLINTENLHPATGPRAIDDSAHGASRLRRQINVHFAAVRVPLSPPRQSWYLPVKDTVDRVGALFLLVLTAPLILLTALLVKMTSRGSAFYTQTRVGRKGSLFTIYKIRTMFQNCESLTGPRWCVPADPRVTWVGRLLRLSHLDELPQLVNVVRGEMSLVGPRPERPEFIPNLHKEIPAYPGRMAVRPGVTGLAQVNLPADTSLASVRLKLAYDMYYIRKLSFWLDLRIVLCTALYSVGVPFRFSRKLFRLPAGEPLEQAMQPILKETATEFDVKVAA